MISLWAQTAEYIRPLKQPLILLSGNFGELRATHFHAGIDFRTGGREGLPVLCVRDGCVARVRVSPAGYGQALYVEHMDGTTTVYGHLQRFNKRIEAVVRELQYRQESFEIDEDMKGYRLFFKQGDTIAYSGNTGSSGGPHLHFEIRDTKSERLLNPLKHYNIKDNIPPRIKGVYCYSVSDSGCVDMASRGTVQSSGPGRYSAGNVVVPAGRVGIAVWGEDFMDGSQNKLGLYKIIMKADNDTLFGMQMDTLAFGLSGFINEIKDFKLYKKGGTVYRCFGNYHNQLPGVKNMNGGYVNIGQGQKVTVEIKCSDINNNYSTLRFTLVGGSAQKETDEAELLFHNRAYCLTMPGCELLLDSNSLLSSIKKNVYTEYDTVRKRNIYIFAGGEEPLLKKARLNLYGKFSPKTLVCEYISDSRLYPLKTGHDTAGIYAYVSCLGKYVTIEDITPPVITYLGISGGKLQFRVKDDFSGLGKLRVEVNGKWCLSVFDVKNSLLTCNSDEPAFGKKGVDEVRVIVEDISGNRKELKIRHNNGGK